VAERITIKVRLSPLVEGGAVSMRRLEICGAGKKKGRDDRLMSERCKKGRGSHQFMGRIDAYYELPEGNGDLFPRKRGRGGDGICPGDRGEECKNCRKARSSGYSSKNGSPLETSR